MTLLPHIDWDTCQTCNPCLARQGCNTRALRQIEPDEPPYLEPDRCSSCAQCVLACPCQAIKLINTITLR